MFVYLDNSATTKTYNEVNDVILKVLTDNYGNPSSMHRMGLKIEKEIKETRKIASKILGCNEKEVIFTSGGTESNNLAIQGVVKSKKFRGRHIITTKIEHPSVLNVYKKLEDEGYDVTYLDVDDRGFLNFEQLKNEIREDTILVSIMYVNNEIGTIQPVEKIGKYLDKLKNKPHFHVDAVQAFGKIRFKCKNIKCDTLSLSSHKIHGPKGAGILYLKNNANIERIYFGGGQELNIRPGTENTLGIVGMGKAMEIMNYNLEKDIEKMKILKEKLFNGIKEIELAHFNSEITDDYAPHILNVSFEGLKGEVILHSLEMKDIYVSTGSACSSKKKVFSHVIDELKISDSLKAGAIRFSLSSVNTEDEIDYTVESLKIIIEDLEKIILRR